MGLLYDEEMAKVVLLHVFRLGFPAILFNASVNQGFPTSHNMKQRLRGAVNQPTLLVNCPLPIIPLLEYLVGCFVFVWFW